MACPLPVLVLIINGYWVGLCLLVDQSIIEQAMAPVPAVAPSSTTSSLSDNSSTTSNTTNNTTNPVNQSQQSQQQAPPSMPMTWVTVPMWLPSMDNHTANPGATSTTAKPAQALAPAPAPMMLMPSGMVPSSFFSSITPTGFGAFAPATTPSNTTTDANNTTTPSSTKPEQPTSMEESVASYAV